MKLLGNTLSLIAQQKAGIFKPGVAAFTVPQHESAMKILYEKAKEVNVCHETFISSYNLTLNYKT